MTFSIRSLLAIILLAALVANGWLARLRINREQVAIGILETQVVENEQLLGDFEKKKLAYERFLDAATKRSARFALAENEFDKKIASKYGQLKVEDDSKLAIVTYPTFDRGNGYQKRWRIFVPESSPRKLSIRYLDADRDPTEFASLFYPNAATEFDLPSGRSDLHFVWEKDTGTCRILLDDETLYETKFKEETRGWSTSGASGFQQLVQSKPRELTFVRFRPNHGEQADRQSLQIRIVTASEGKTSDE